MLSDLPLILTWWTMLLIIGLVFLPIGKILFGKFFDAGYIFVKIFGILTVSFTLWFLSSLHLIRFSSFNPWLVVLLFLVLNVFFARQIFKEVLLRHWKIIVFEELLFLVLLTIYSFIRATAPDIHGLEKYMDFGFINSILKTDYFPPKDIWLSGTTINYYYFGHFVTALLTKLSFLDSAVTFNLMLALVLGFCFMGAFSLTANLIYLSGLINFGDGIDIFRKRTQIIIVGLLGAFLTTLAGNLHTIYLFTSGYPNDTPIPFWNILSGFNPTAYWYPNATRFIPYTIHEFPSYSFVVSDLHGHVLDIPFVILTLGLIVSYIHIRKTIFMPILGLSLGIMYMTNAWDGIIYLMVVGLAILLVSFKEIGIIGVSFIKKVFTSSLLVGVFYLISTLLFNRSFKPFVNGILPVPSDGGSPAYMLLVLWGFFYFNAISFSVFTIIPGIRNVLNNKRADLSGYSPGEKKKPRQIDLNILGFKIAISTDSLYQVGFTPPQINVSLTDITILIFILISTFLIIFPEFLYIKDIYPQHYRANTMFKLGYQAFVMLSISSAYIFFRISRSMSRNKIFYLLCFVPLFILVAVYPYFGFKSYFNGFKQYYGINGVSYLSKSYPSDFMGISWLSQNAVGQPVVLEAVGESYTDYARVSVHTGFPTVIGWPVHEWLWRGSYDEAGKRLEEVKKVYEDPLLQNVLSTLDKYEVEYIFVGQLEKDKYPNLSLNKFYEWGNVVFEEGETIIFQKRV